MLLRTFLGMYIYAVKLWCLYKLSILGLSLIPTLNPLMSCIYRRPLYPKLSRSSRRKMKIPNPLSLDGLHRRGWRPNSSGPRHLSDICWLKLQFVFVTFRCIYIYRVTIQVSFCLGHFHLSMPGLVCFHMHRRIQGPISKMWWRTARSMVWSRS